jgi:hypothetical protein
LFRFVVTALAEHMMTHTAAVDLALAESCPDDRSQLWVNSPLTFGLQNG